jgi:hypothetical protein
LVFFDLPFPLLVRDSLKEENDDRPAEDLAPEIYVLGNPPAGVRTVLRANERAAVQARGELVGGDPYGRVSYTSVQVRFNCAESPQVADWTDDQLIETAIRASNRVIELYRDIAHKPVLRPVTPYHIVHYWITEGWSEGEKRTRVVSRGRGPLQIGISDEQLRVETILRRRLQSDSNVEFVRSLYLDAFAHLELGNYRLAVVEAAVLFEAWLKGFLVQQYEVQGLTASEIRAKFITASGRHRTVTYIADHLVRDATGLDFAKTDENGVWKTRVRDLRNAVVHGEETQLSEQDAAECLNAVTVANKLIQTAVSPLPGSETESG